MSTAQPIDSDPPHHLVLLFAGLYLIEGLCALSCLQRLPFDHFGADVAGRSTTYLASMHAPLARPWRSNRSEAP